MPRPEKEAVVEEVAEILNNAKSVFVTDFEGLDVAEISELRRKCREASVGYRVVKNTLARLAVKKIGCEEMVPYLEGPSALAYSYDDPSAPARVIAEFARTVEKPKIKMSRFEGLFFGPDKVAEIAALPSKDVLIAKLIGGLNAPMQRLIGGLGGLVQKLVRTIDAVRAEKEKQE